MPIYYHRLCDRAGRTLLDEKIEAASLQHAMVHANTGLGRMISRTPTNLFDPEGRIEIVDTEGHPLARIYCAEAIAARQ